MADTLILFGAFALVAIATPGPTVLLALANGSRLGLRASLPGLAGAALSDIVLVTAVALGLGALLAASELAFSAVKWVGVAYLAWLGVRLLRSRAASALPSGSVAAPAEPPAARAVFLRSFLVAVTNPKGYLFVGAFFPQFIDSSAPLLAQYLALATVFVGIDCAVMLAYAAAGARAVRLLREGGVVWLDRLCGAALLGLAGALATLRRQLPA